MHRDPSGSETEGRGSTWIPSSNSPTDCICGVKTSGSYKEYVGIITNVDTKNNADALLFQSEKVLKDAGDAVDAADKEAIEKAQADLRAVIDSPSVPAMECIGGTGDIVTGLVTAFAAAGWPLCAACQAASRSARRLAVLCEPRPDTPVADLIRRLPDALTPDWLRELEDSRG